MVPGSALHSGSVDLCPTLPQAQHVGSFSPRLPELDLSFPPRLEDLCLLLPELPKEFRSRPRGLSPKAGASITLTVPSMILLTIAGKDFDLSPSFSWLELNLRSL